MPYIGTNLGTANPKSEGSRHGCVYVCIYKYAHDTIFNQPLVTDIGTNLETASVKPFIPPIHACKYSALIISMHRSAVCMVSREALIIYMHRSAV